MPVKAVREVPKDHVEPDRSSSISLRVGRASTIIWGRSFRRISGRQVSVSRRGSRAALIPDLLASPPLVIAKL